MKKKKQPFREEIVEYLNNHPKKFLKAKELARVFRIPPRDYTEFRNLLRQMVDEKLIAKFKGNCYGTARQTSYVQGKLHVKTQGYGFLVTPEGEEDVFISQKNMATALDGDVVKVQLFAAPEGKLPEGRVVEVLERARKYIVGTLAAARSFYYVMPDNLKITHDVFVYDDGLNGAKPGQKVAVVIDQWEKGQPNPEGHVVEILGNPKDPGVDVLAVAMSFDLPIGFSKEILDVAQKISGRITPEIVRKRLDLRDRVCFTIDPPDAKDFDDAVSLQRLKNGNWELGVHIADVSHYVKENGAIDKEAYDRGTSAYLVDRVVAMLPERLSTELCSLKPETDRLTFSCIMELTKAGHVVRHRIAESVIHSKKRFSYQEVQSFLDGKLDLPDVFATPLRDMRALAKTLRKQRLEKGSLNFDTPEAKVIVDENGKPVQLTRQESLESMKVVEEFMLMANKTVASHISAYKTEEGLPPFIYRVHERPTPEKMRGFAEFVSALGHSFRYDSRISSKKLSTFIDSIRGTDEEVIIENVMLRSLMKARYDVENAGHFGLAFKNYTHFTSPIRRYADLVVHRLLKQLLNHGWQEEQRAGLTGRLEKICQHVSGREVVAMEAERASIKMKQAEYMMQHQGQEFDGIISGVTHFGIFVEIPQFLVEGLVHISDLDDDYYTYNEKTYSLEGTSTKTVFRIGDAVRIRVVRADPAERLIDFILIEKHGKKKKKKRRRGKKAKVAE